MKTALLALLASSLALATPAARAAATPIPTPPAVPTTGYILLDHDSGRVLASQKADERMEPASITKLMTAYIVFEALAEKRLALTDTVRVSEYAWRTGGAVTDGSNQLPGTGLDGPGRRPDQGDDRAVGQRCHDRAGREDRRHRIRLRADDELLFPAAWPQGHALDQQLGRPCPRPLQHGTGHRHAVQRADPQVPRVLQVLLDAEFTWNKHTQQNRNGLLARDPSVDGIKTGHTESAKYCLVSSAKRNGMRLVSVVLGSPSIRAREDASATLLNYGFTFYETVKLQDAGKPVLTPRVFKGSAESVAVGSPNDISITIARGQGASLTKEHQINAPLVAPLALHARVGEYVVSNGDEVVARVPLVTLAKVEEGGLWRTTVDAVKLWFE
jgi:D-alanyl-D-alanine carboxypeptidase (penicillin-binding protein 5/6)